MSLRARLLAEPTPLQGRLVVGYGRFVSGAYTLLGLVGLFRTSLDHFSNVTGHDFLIFTVNPQTNLIQLIAGLVGIAMCVTPRWARLFCLLVGVLGIPWAIAGFALDGSLSDFFATNPAINVVHLAVSVLALAVAVWPRWPDRAPGAAGGFATPATGAE